MWQLLVLFFVVIILVLSPISTDAENAFYIYIDELPPWADFAGNVAYRATEAWKEVNPGLEFYVASSPSTADIHIQWVKEFGTTERVGQTVNQWLVEVGLGDSNCKGKWQPYSENYITHIMEHEIGHVFGHEHDNDPDSIMYPIALNLEYGLVEEEITLTENYAQFQPFCTIKDVTSFEYAVSVDDPTYGFDVYVVPSEKSLDDWANGESFQYYSGQGCSAKNYRVYSNTCSGVALGSGLLIIMDNTLTEKLTHVTIKTQEVSTSTTLSGEKFNVEEHYSEPPSTKPPTYSSPNTGDVTIVMGTSVPGCEKTNSCYSPYQIRVGPTSTVTWYNADSAAHTVTSGTPSGGPDGEFDSSLFMSGTTFSHKFDTTGTYPYLCMVHPWMTGYVIVERGGSIISPSQTPPTTEPTPFVDVYADWDNDGIADYRDQCKFNAETINGYQDSDGCPDTHKVTPSQSEYKDLAYSSKSTYRTLLDQLKSGIETAESSLSGLQYQNPEAQKKIEQAWVQRFYARDSLQTAELKFGAGENEIEKGRFQTAVNFFNGVDSYSVNIGNNLREISAAINDAKNLETQYQSENASKQEEKFCFLFWCW